MSMRSLGMLKILFQPKQYEARKETKRVRRTTTMTLSQCTLDMTRKKEMFNQCHRTLRRSQMLTDLTPTIMKYKHQTVEKDQVVKAKATKIQETPMNFQNMKQLQRMKATRFKRKMKLIHPSLMNPSRHQKSKKVPMHYRLGHLANL